MKIKKFNEDGIDSSIRTTQELERIEDLFDDFERDVLNNFYDELHDLSRELKDFIEDNPNLKDELVGRMEDKFAELQNDIYNFLQTL